MQLLFAQVIAVDVVNHRGQNLLYDLADGNFSTRIVIVDFHDLAAVDDAAALQYRATAAPR